MHHDAPNLPMEIIDIVIGVLGSDKDKKSLSRVALTSSSLVFRAQSYLFHSINLDRTTGCPLLNSRYYATFDDLLENSAYNIRHHVRELFVEIFNLPGSYDYTYSTCCYNTPNSHKASPSQVAETFAAKSRFLLSILPKLPRVTHFSLNYGKAEGGFLKWRNLSPTVGQEITRFCLQESITSLSLTSIVDLPPSLIFNIAKLPRLISLRLESIVIDDSADTSAYMIEKSFLENLRQFWFIPDSPFGEGSLKSSKFLDLIGDLILKAAHESLHAFTCFNRAYRPELRAVNVGVLRNLKTITLRLDSHPHSVGIDPFLRQISQSGRTTVEVIELISVRQLSVFGAQRRRDEWVLTDSLLQDGPFSRLVEIRVSPQYGGAIGHLEVRAMLPKTCGRGVAVVQGVEHM